MKKKNYSEILTTVLCTVFGTSKLSVKYDISGYYLWYDGSLIYYDVSLRDSNKDLSDLAVFFIQRVQSIASRQLLSDIDYLPF